jgi:hypothetical protein
MAGLRLAGISALRGESPEAASALRPPVTAVALVAIPGPAKWRCRSTGGGI